MNHHIAARFLATTLVFMLASTDTPAQKTEAAIADREAHFAASEWGYIYYLDLDPWVGEEKTDLEKAIRLMVASTSLQPIIERTVPVPVPNSPLLRIDLRNLGWRYADWRHVMAKYPYGEQYAVPGPHENAALLPAVDNQAFAQRRGNFQQQPPPQQPQQPVVETTVEERVIEQPTEELRPLPLLIRADWLLIQLADSKRSDAYHTLLYGANQPKTRDDILNRLGVGNDKLLTFGLIEGQSGVSKQGVRLIENRPIFRGYAWGTRDILKIEPGKDPLEHPDGAFKHDGEEWIIGIPKLSAGKKGFRGVLQIYFLANGQGNLVAFAPVDLVEDKTEFRGNREIVSPGSCIQCHATGLNPHTTNEFRNLIDSGVDVFADQRTSFQLEAFHLGDIEKELFRGQDDYQTMVELICGAKSAHVSASFKRAVDRYDAPLTLWHTADELGASVETWARALAVASGDGTIGARLAGLAHGRTIPRDAWEIHYRDAVNMIEHQP